MAVFTKLVHTLYHKQGKLCTCYINVSTTYIYQLIINLNYLTTQFPLYCHMVANFGVEKLHLEFFKENYKSRKSTPAYMLYAEHGRYAPT